MWEHVHRLNGSHFVFDVEKRQIPCLSGRVAADVDNAARLGAQYHVDHITMHACTRRIHYHDVGSSVLGYKTVGKHIFHVAGEEESIVDAVDA